MNVVISLDLGWVWGCAVAALALAPGLAAQGESSKTPEPEAEARGEFKRPKYQFLRQNEDWSDLAGRDREQTGDPLDLIKYIPLSDDGEVWASFGGHLRGRVEGWNNYDFGNPPGVSHDDVFLLTRVFLHGDVHIGDNLRVFGEFKSAHSSDRDLPGGRRILDADPAELQQAFVDIKAPIFNDKASLTVRPGRQMLLLGAQRLVSPLPWANTVRTWDGISAILDAPGWKVTGFWAEFVPIDQYDWNTPDDGTRFYGGYATTNFPTSDLGWDFYFLGLEKDMATFNGTSGEEDRYTIGTRVFGDLGGGFDIDAEGAWQVGTVGRSDINAQMFSAEAGFKIEDFLPGSRVFVGFDWASGDRRTGGDVQTFNHLFPLGHKYLGFMDTIGRQNVYDVSLGFAIEPIEKMRAWVHYHNFWLDSRTDALYNAGGAAIRPAAAIDSYYVGSELDFRVTWGFRPHMQLLAGYSHFFAGDVLEDSGPSEDMDFVYTQLTVTF